MMDYNSIDEDDVDNLRLAALMTIKKKSYLPTNTGSSIPEKYFPHIFSDSSSQGSSYNNPARNNGGWFPSSKKSFTKRSLSHVSFQKSAYPNRNLIAIVPSDIECDIHADLSNSTLTLTSEDKNSSNIHNSNNKVSTKFSRLEHESDSEESEDSEPEINEKDESDDCDILSLGGKDKDLDDLDKLMDIMEAEIANGVSESSNKESSNLKISNDYIAKNATELNANRDVPILLNQPKIIEVSKSQSNPPKEEIESTITLETNTSIKKNSPSPCTSLKSSVVLRSPMPSNMKRSVSPYTKYLNRCSTTVGHSKLPHRSLSPIKEKILSPVQYSPKSQISSSSPKKTESFLSQIILPSNKRQLSPVSRKSRSPLKRKSQSTSSNSPIKKLLRSRLISPTIQCAGNKDHLQKTVKVEPVDKQVEMRGMSGNPILEVVDFKKLSIQHHTDSVDLRTEIKRRRALRLNMNQWDEKKKEKSFYPTRLLQSAIRDVVDSSANDVKRMKCSYKPEIRVQTEGNSNGRRGVLLSENQYNFNDELESCASAKRLKGNCKKVPLHLRVTGFCNNNMKQKGFKKIIRQHINVTDIDQM